ncbi:unnamed protein product, partial [Mesorhabditis spiculigera]
MGNLTNKQIHSHIHVSQKQASALSNTMGAGSGRSPCQIAQMALAAPDEKSHPLVLSFIRVSSAEEISRVCDASGIPVQAKNEAISEFGKGHHDRAATILVAAAEQKLRESTRELSGQAGGKRMLKSEHGTFMRAYDGEWKVDLMRGEPRDWEHWYVEDWGSKVVFKAIHSPGRFLRARADGKVDLVPTHPNECPASKWKPFKNSDGSWSFLSIHGTWLSGLGNDTVCCMWECKSSEKFTLPWW